MDEPKIPPERLAELSPDARKFLAGLRPDELDTLREVVKLPAQDIRDGFKFVRELRAFGKFGRWLILTVISIFVGTIFLYEQILKVVAFLKGGPSQ